jgi:peptidoglycan/xylan/chitin deacetylase (PgdA/CDA1 family)
MRFLQCLLLLLILQTAYAQKQMAITVDDLPFVGADEDPKRVMTATNEILKAFKKHKIRSVGFVNEIFTIVPETVDQNIRVLTRWASNKHELGNHTFSHMSLNQNSLENYIQDIQKGGIGHANTLNNEYLNRPMRYFRHPYLQTGNDSLKKYGLEAFLKKDEYIAVPVTIEAGDWIFNHAYRKALTSKDLKFQDYIGEEYVKFTLEYLKYYEELSMEVVGRPMSHIALFHANDLNGKYLGRILDEFKEQGYNFIRVNEALADPAYALPDKVITEGGFSWLHRWRISAGKKTNLVEPKIPQKIIDLYENEF